MTLALRNAEVRDAFLDLVRELPETLHARMLSLLESVVFKDELEAYVAAEVTTLNATITALTAADIATSTTDFGGNLSSADDTVQKALDTLDDHA